MSNHLFVNIMMALQIGAIGQYIYQQDWKYVFYWVGCLVINYVVTYRF